VTSNDCPVGAPVVEYFDHHDPAYVSDRFEWFDAIRATAGPVFWTPHWGGYWVVIGWDELTSVAKDWETYSSRPFGDAEDGVAFNGHFIPSPADLVGDERGARPSAVGGQGRGLLSEDPPEWNDSRKLMAPIFSPPAVDSWRPRMFDLVDAFVDRHIESGEIDFAEDLTNVLPAVFSLELVGLSSEPFRNVAKMHHATAHLKPGEVFAPEVAEGLGNERLGVMHAIHDPDFERKGVIGYLLDARDRGVELSDADIMGLVGITIAGGIDTTAAALGTTLVVLTEHPELREQLRARPELLPDAAEEFLRISAPTQLLCRTVTRDVELGGQELRRGDRVMLCFPAANRDPAVFECPHDVVLDRQRNRHVTFGSGIHRCIGSQFAKLEWEATVSTLLARMPDFRVDVDAARTFDDIGIVMGWRSLPATFTPGRRVGVDPDVPGWEF